MINAGGLTLLPGGVDPHVHIRYPGGAHRETFVTGTASAAGGKHIEEIGRVTPIDHAASRPAVAEALAVDRLIRLAETIDCPFYLVHISTPEVVEATKATRAKGMNIWIETCPQYLYLTEEALNEYGSYAKCNPALRDKSRVKKMWDYIENGTIDTVGSDHAPYAVEEKERNPQDIFLAPAGFPGLETRFGLMMKAVADGRISLRRAVELIATNPAKAYGLYPRKGAIKIGADADFILCDPKAEYMVEKDRMQTMAKDIAKVFDGWKLNGIISKVVLRGKVIYEDGKVVGEPGYGKCLLKGRYL